MKYEELRSFMQERLPEDIDVYKEFHALIVKLSKEFCKVTPVCHGCPLKNECKQS